MLQRPRLSLKIIHTSLRVRYFLAVMVGLTLFSSPTFSQESSAEEILESHPLGLVSPEIQAELSNEALHTQLVTAAIEYDTFNQRCRGVSAAYNESKVNRLFLNKFGITMNDYMMNYMSKDANDPRDVKQKIVTRVYQSIAKMGGCQPARSKGLEKNLKDEYRNLYHQVEKSTWFPSVHND